MKHMKRINFLAGFLAGMGVLLVGCGKQPVQLDQGWSSPVVVSESIGSLGGYAVLYKCFDTIIAVQSLADTSVKCMMMKRDAANKDSWAEIPAVGLPRGYTFFPTVEQSSGRLLFPQEHAENNQSTIRALFIRTTRSGEIQVQGERKWTADKKVLFGETGPNVKLESGPYFGGGVINDSDMYLPFCADGETVTTHSEDGPFNNGVFHSTDSGVTWQMEKISDFGGLDPLVCKTKNYYYYVATRIIPRNGYHLWFSRKSAQGGSWEQPGKVTKTYAMIYGRYVAVGEDDTVHVSWMDRRHDMWRFNIDGPNIENDDIVYCHRKDSYSGWSKDVLLSKGLLYSYPPSMSVDGKKIVVAWAGIRSARKNHNEYDPNDIYYATSKDGGKTWTKPLMVTDRAKDGIVSGKPQVMLLNGVIHLFYIQGTLGKPDLLSPGLTKLSQGPWPIYYTQRPFPD